MHEITLSFQDGRKLKTKSLVYSGGELKVEVPELPLASKDTITLIARLQSSDDIMRLVLLREILDRTHDGSINAVIPYFPYARQDRVTAENDAFSLLPMADMINLCGFQNVICYDLHSPALKTMLPNLHEIKQVDIVRQHVALNEWIVDKRAELAIISPDRGALSKAKAVAQLYGLPIVICEKTRDALTGKLSAPRIQHEGPLPKNLLIVDDICDGGGTFIQLAEELKRHQSDVVISLYVTHGIFSRGLLLLLEQYTKIFTTDSFDISANPARILYKEPYFHLHPLQLEQYPPCP